MVTDILMTTLSKLLRKISDDIDYGNSNLNEKESVELVEVIKQYTDKTERISKYEACRYLNVSRATFDNYVREGKLPKDKHHIGFKELSWEKKDLDIFINKVRNKK